MKTLSHCGTLVFGGTAFACGIAFRKPTETLILEREIQLLPEFAQSLSSIVLSEPVTEEGKRIRRELERRGVASGGKLHPPPASAVFTYLAMRKNCHILLSCDVVEVESAGGGGYHVIISGIDGLNCIRAERIIDTTPEGWRNVGRDHIRGKSLSAAICGMSVLSVPNGGLKCASFTKGILPGELLLRVDLPADATWHEARIRLHDIMRHLRKENPDLAVGGEASALAYEYEEKNLCRTMKNGIIWNPSAQYKDLIAAFEEGWKCGLA